MFTPPAEVSAVLSAFASLFTRPSWARAQALLCGTLLAPANHTVAAALRALGLAGEPGFQNYHRLLNRARWSARQVAQVLEGTPFCRTEILGQQNDKQCKEQYR